MQPNHSDAKRRRVEVVPTADDLVRVAAELVTAAAIISIAQRGAFSIALAGGSTPRPLYARLADDQDINWKQWHLFWGDERCVPPDHPDSNYGMVREALLDRLSASPGLVVRMSGELEPDVAAYRYEKTIWELVPATYSRSGRLIPQFDLILLGMGEDGHTASLFPQTKALNESERLVVANPVPQLDSTRLTFTYPLINAAHRVLFLVSGQRKAQVLHEVLSGPQDPQQRPSQGVMPSEGQLTWLVDQAAFSAIESAMGKE